MARKSRKTNLSPAASSNLPAAYSVALYARLSVETEQKQEADTIGKQVQLLQEYVRKQSDMKVYGIYCDDDVSGTDFLRPEFSRMMEDIRKGNVNCIVVKDLSRLGRNGIESGEYLEMIFPALRVRFISILDQFDSNYCQVDMGIQLKNLLNERYAKDISQKICSAMETLQKQGKYVAGLAPYGYVKDPEDRHHLIPDQQAAPVVAELFDLAVKGVPLHSLSKMFNERGVPSPGRHRYDLGLVHAEKFRRSFWTIQTIRKILSNPVYLGQVVGGQYRSTFAQTGQKGSAPVPEEQWIIAEGAHTPLVTPQVFHQAQEILQKKREAAVMEQKSERGREVNPLKGILRCGSCGKPMNLRTKKSHGKETKLYYCSLHEGYGNTYCSTKAVKKRDLESILLDVIRHHLLLYQDARKTVARLNRAPCGQAKYQVFQKQVEETRRKLASLREAKASLYRNYVESTVTEEVYASRLTHLNARAAELQLFLEELEIETQKRAPTFPEQGEWDFFLRAFENATGLEQEMAKAMLENVTLFPNGRYEITFRFQGEWEKMLSLAAQRQEEVERRGA